MNMHWVDWTVIICMTAFFTFMAWYSRRYTRSAADFLAASRAAGRYLLTMSEGMACMGAVSIVAVFQMTYKVGFAAGWWAQIGMPVGLMLMLAGWIIYRYRETRALTLGQLLEMRYGRRFRIFAGTICWISGIVNFGIFPAVGANFFINYCGLAESYAIAGTGISLPTYHSLLVLLIGISLYFTFSGGQIAVLVTDFFQSFFCNVVLVTTLVILLIKFPLSQVFEGLLIAEPGKSMLNPFDAGGTEFSPAYFLIGMINFSIYNRLSWQGHQAYNSSAISPHEAKMAGVLAGFRSWGFMFSLTLLPLVAYLIMHHSDYSVWAGQITKTLSGIEDEQVREQMITPMTMTLYLPLGLMGAFAAVMFAAFISTHDTYLHSWGSIFVQDVLLPLRKKQQHLDPKKHMLLLRCSIIFVALFIFLWSCFFRPRQAILMYFAITGAIWMGGSGAVIIGALYTRWGKALGAYVALASSGILATAGMVCIRYWKDWFGEAAKFPLTAQEVFFGTMLVAVVCYVVFSLIGKRTHFNLDKLLHRGQYRVETDHKTADAVGSATKWNFKQAVGLTKEFTRFDKFVYWLTFYKSMIFFAAFLAMTAVALIMKLLDDPLTARGWGLYFRYSIWVTISTSFIIAIWLSVGGLRDVFRLFRALRRAKRDYTDDGLVTDHDFTEPDEPSSEDGQQPPLVD